MKKYEIGTPQFKIFNDCLDCAFKIALNYKKQGVKVYIRDIINNILVYDAYFKTELKGGKKGNEL